MCPSEVSECPQVSPLLRDNIMYVNLFVMYVIFYVAI